MCGRYVMTSPPAAVRAQFGYVDRPNFPRRYNIAPAQPVAIVRLESGQRRLALVRWGLIPSWVKDPRGFSLLVNARSESVLEKPAFRAAMSARRCLFPADGFYEWRREGRQRRPYFIRRSDGAPMAFAGLWEVWTGPNGEEMETAAILTTAANRELAPIHHRMPALIPPEAFDQWLDTARVSAASAARLLVPAPDGVFDLHPVSSAVNRATIDAAFLIDPVTEPPPGRDHQPTLFER